MPHQTLAGKLLVATPLLADPSFARSVVIVVEHGERGANGFVLNRLSRMLVGEPLPRWGTLAAAPGVVHFGGPVQEDTLVCVASSKVRERRFLPVLDEIAIVDPAGSTDGIDTVRVFAGHAGWWPGQLENEIAEGAWFVVDASPDDILGPSPERLWRTVLRRQRGEAALYADYPTELRLN